MNVKELNEDVKANQKRKIQEAIKEIEERIRDRANRGFSSLRVATDRDVYDMYEIDHFMIEPLKEYFENNGYRVELEEIKGISKWFEKIFYKAIYGAYLQDYFMIIRW